MEPPTTTLGLWSAKAPQLLPKCRPVPVVTLHPCHQLQQEGQRSLLQSLNDLIPETAVPQRQLGKQSRWDAGKVSSPKSSKPSARICDQLRCIFSHEKQMLKVEPEYSSTNSKSRNLQRREEQAGAAGLISIWKSQA